MRHALAAAALFALSLGWGVLHAQAEESVWCYPEYFRIGPVKGEVAEWGFKPVTPEFKRKNAVYDASSRTVSLVGQKGETLAFQIMIEGNHKGVTLETQGLPKTVFSYEGYLHASDGKAIHWVPEVDLPLDWIGNTFDVQTAPEPFPVIPGKTQQAVWADIAIPRDAQPGTQEGLVTVKAGGQDLAAIKVGIRVVDAAIPEQPVYNFALIQYGLCAKKPSFLRSMYVKAHDHRATVHDIPYSSQRGWGYEGCVPRTTFSDVYKDMAPWDRAEKEWKNGKGSYKLLPEYAHLTDIKNHTVGKGEDWDRRMKESIAGQDATVRAVREIYKEKGAGITDWTDFDAKFGPLFDGSAFADGVPLNSFELPFNYNWPAPLDTFNIQDPKQSEMYEDIWMKVAQDFVAHANEKGWDRTLFFVYFNPKDSGNNMSMWKGDEPCELKDFKAHLYFYNLTQKAFAKPGKMKVGYKIEIGHFECDHVKCRKADMDNKTWDESKAAEMLKDITYWSISSHYHGAVDLIEKRTKELGHVYYRYGSPQTFDESAMGIYGMAFLAMDDHSNGFFIYAPSMNSVKAFKEKSSEADIRAKSLSYRPLYYDPADFGKSDEALLSLRWKSLRGAEQHLSILKAAQTKDPAFAEKLNEQMVNYIAMVSGKSPGYKVPVFNNNPDDLYTARLNALSILAGADLAQGRAYAGPIKGVSAQSDTFHYCVGCGEACSPVKCEWCGADQKK